MAIKDGGPAFPLFIHAAGNCGPGVNEGLSLRDYFAGQALIALMSSELWTRGLDSNAKPGEFKAALAAHAYVLADHMLAEREKGRS
jgi:hypothetical protein